MSCDVIADCLRRARATREPFGIWVNGNYRKAA